jgi:hypothetical protein
MTTEQKELQGIAKEIWNEIKGLSIDMFALPGQTVEMYLTPIPLDPSRCFMTYTASSVLPSLEITLGINPSFPDSGKYRIENQGKFIIVSRGPAHHGA